jgi:AraC-like DNA-binding protein
LWTQFTFFHGVTARLPGEDPFETRSISETNSQLLRCGDQPADDHMKIVQQTIASLGPPIWIEPLERSYGTGAVIARWRHLNGRLQISTADAVQVCLSLSTGQRVRHAERDRSLSKSVLAGDVIVLRPGIPTETTLEGDAEVVQIFISLESLGRAASQTLAARLVAPQGNALKRAAIQLFVAARHDDRTRRAVAEVKLRERVRDFLAAPADDEIGYVHGGLPSMAISRAERLIAEAMDSPNSASPTVRELAATARVSTNHYIRSFRQMRGTTPHQLVMVRRCQRAMELLRQSGLTIADVSDAAGYSSPAYFIASFKHQLGVTPGAYQRAVTTKG